MIAKPLYFLFCNINDYLRVFRLIVAYLLYVPTFVAKWFLHRQPSFGRDAHNKKSLPTEENVLNMEIGITKSLDGNILKT